MTPIVPQPSALGRHSPNRSRALALLVTLAVLLAACGGSDEASSDTVSSVEDSSTEETATEDTETDAAEDEGTTDKAEEATSEESALFDLLSESAQSSGELTFGALWETPPVIGVDPSDTTVPVGLAPDLAAAMAPLLGVEIVWENMQWPAQLPGVQSGAVDALFGQVSITEERELSIVDLTPFSQTTEGILVPAGNPEGLTRLGDACGLSMGVPVGSTQSELVMTVSAAACVANGEPAIELSEYQGASAAISALLAGTVDGWINTVPSQLEAIEAQGDALEMVDIPVDEKPPTYTGIAIGKDQPGVSEAVAEALRMLIEDGTYDALMAEWGMTSSAITADQVVINPLTGTEVGVVAE